MTDSGKRNRSAPALAALAAAIALAGCSATHVGESWQCPLAQGAECDSVAAADPAVPDAEAREPVPRAPLYEARGGERPEAPGRTRPCEAGCGGFDPFAWLARLFGADGGGGAQTRQPDGAPPRNGVPSPGRAGATPLPETTEAAPESGAEPAARSSVAESAGAPVSGAGPGGASPAPVPARVPRFAEGRTGAPDGVAAAAPAAAGLPALPDTPDAEESLRTGETIGRIWIAPFVDADGVYREAFHVRVVLEPAGWRLP